MNELDSNDNFNIGNILISFVLVKNVNLHFCFNTYMHSHIRNQNGTLWLWKICRRKYLPHRYITLCSSRTVTSMWISVIKVNKTLLKIHSSIFQGSNFWRTIIICDWIWDNQDILYFEKCHFEALKQLWFSCASL